MKKQIILMLTMMVSFGSSYGFSLSDLSPDSVINDLKGLAGKLKIDVPVDSIESGLKNIGVNIDVNPTQILSGIQKVTSDMTPLLKHIGDVGAQVGKNIAGISQSMFDQAKQLGQYATEHLKEAGEKTAQIAKLGLTGKEKEAAEEAVKGLKSQAKDLLGQVKNNIMYGIGILKLGFKDFVMYAGGEVFNTIEDAVQAIAKDVPCGKVLSLGTQLPQALVANTVLSAVLTAAEGVLDNLEQGVKTGAAAAETAGVALKPIAGAVYKVTSGVISKLSDADIDIKTVDVDLDFKNPKDTKFVADIEIMGKTIKADIDPGNPAETLKNILKAVSGEIGGISGVAGKIKSALD